MKWPKTFLACFSAVCAAIVFSSVVHAGARTNDKASQDLPILQKWSGDFPLAHLDRLPEGQTNTSIGYIGIQSVFANVWKAFKPEDPVPKVDFNKILVVFTRNVVFYNRLSIFKVTIKDGTVDVMSMETRSALPIEDNAAMAMAVIPREGIKNIQVKNKQISVLD